MRCEVMQSYSWFSGGVMKHEVLGDFFLMNLTRVKLVIRK